MIVGVPKEIKTDEYRVAMIPVGVEELTRAGHQVLIQAGAGQGSGISDAQYAAAGAEIVADAGEIWASGRPDREGQGTAGGRVAADAAGPDRLHLLPLRRRRALTRAVIDRGITAIAYETIRDTRAAAAADADERGRRAG